MEDMLKRPIRATDIVCDDPGLSLAAKGMFALVGLVGPGCTLADLSERTTDPPEFIAMVLDELHQAGYLNVTDERITVPPSGRFGVGMSMIR